MRTGEANPIVGVDTKIKEVLIAITRARAGAATVVNEKGKLVGIFTDGDLRRALEKHPDVSAHRLSDLMIRNPITITSEKLIVEAARVMRGENPKGRKLDELPVVDEKHHPVGMLDVVDLIGII
jgi:arabinose-5-phosphate isomerase